MLKKISIFVLVGTLSLLIFPFISYSDNSQVAVESLSNTNLLTNPFELVKNRIVPGTIFQIKVDKDLFGDNQDKITEIALEYEIPKKDKKNLLIIRKHYFEYKDNDLRLSVEMPSWDKIKNIRAQSVWSGWLRPYRARLKISFQKAERINTLDYPVEIPYILWAYIWGIMAVIASFVIIWLLKPEPLKAQEEFAEDRSKKEWEETSKVKRFFLYPLNFAITPQGTYSISITQILFWTYITIFGIVYVYWLSGSFLDITPQMLTLLGIGGGTALFAKINAQSKVPELSPKYLNLVKKTRTPKLKDLISIGGQPNIFKFQILAFTLLTGYIVIVDIVKSHAFPTIPNSLVTMMGVSSVIYLGNEVSHKSKWEEIKKTKEAIEKKAKEKNIEIKLKDAEEIKESKKKIPEVEELEDLLEEIYSGEEEEPEKEAT